MITRRKSIQMLAVLSGLLVWPSARLFGKSKKIAFKLEKVKKLKKIGGWAILKIKKHEILFIRDSKESIRAINPICTHKKCTVEFNHKTNRIICPCHGSTFDLDGNVLKEPATKPLQIFPVKLSEGRIILTLED